MRDNILNSFLDEQFHAGMQLAEQSDILELLPVEGLPPRRYLATFRAKGLIQDANGDIRDANVFTVGIWLPDDYLANANHAQVLTYLGPHARPWHPNMRAPFICAHLRPGTPLVQVLHTLFELWTWQLFDTRDEGLNPAASQWARHEESGRFPVDRRPLKRRHAPIKVTLRTEVAST